MKQPFLALASLLLQYRVLKMRLKPKTGTLSIRWLKPTVIKPEFNLQNAENREVHLQHLPKIGSNASKFLLVLLRFFVVQ